MEKETRHHEGDSVILNFGMAGIITGNIEKCYAGNGKVHYDIKIYPFTDEPKNKQLYTILHGVDSYYVEHPNDRFNGKSNVGIKALNN